MHLYINGSITFELKPFYLSILKAWIWKSNLDRIVLLNHNSLTLDGLMTKEETNDIFIFLNRYATLSEANIIGTKRNKIVISYCLHQEKIYEYAYDFNKDKKHTAPFDLFIQVLEENKFTIGIDLESKMEIDFDSFEEAIGVFQHKKNHEIKLAKKYLIEFIKIRKYIELTTHCEKIRLDDPSLTSVTVTPYEKVPTPIELYTSESFLSLYELDNNETRRILIDGVLVPLDTILMFRTIQNHVVLPDGTVTNSCNQCVFRLRNLTGGCKTCTPKKIPLRKKEKE